MPRSESGTLYRHFPTRQALLEAVYIGEVQHALCRHPRAARVAALGQLRGAHHRLVRYLATKKALANELLDYVDKQAGFFRSCRDDLFLAGEPVLKRAQDAKVVRADTDFTEIVQLVGGIAKIEPVDVGQREHILQIALDGLDARRD